MAAWSLAQMPNLQGKTAVVTGGNIGLGFKTSLELARRGAAVVIACRSPAKGAEAQQRILQQCPGAQLDTLALDLLDPLSIAQFAEGYRARYSQLDILVNNAGVVNLPALQRSPAGHEMHFATNHYGHFALTGRLYDLLLATPQARVVTLSSLAANYGKLNFDDLDWRSREYSRDQTYSDSKIANLYFTRSLQQRFVAAGASAIALAAHPGLTGTERQQTIGIGGVLAKWAASSVDKGCLPQLKAATDPEAKGGDYYGPRFGIRGPITNLRKQVDGLDTAVAEKLWQMSEEVTGVQYSEAA